jgi:YVTN family beta-propeller protein
VLVIARRTACEPSAPCEGREGVFVRLTTGATRQSKLYDVPVAKHPPWLRARNLRASVAVAAAGVAVVFVTSACGPAKSDVKTRHVRQALRLPGAPPISSRDRVYTADQASNTVSVINPKTDEVLGTIPLGTDLLGQILGPVDRGQVGVHGLGFSRDGRLLDVISVDSNAAQLIRTQNNELASTTYLGRSPHEGSCLRMARPSG